MSAAVCTALVWAGAHAAPAQADPNHAAGLSAMVRPNVVPPAGPAVAIIIDDLGHSAVQGTRTANLPGVVACAVLPATPYARRIAEQCHSSGKQVMLHMPMQPTEHNASLHPGMLRLGTSRSDFKALLRAGLDDIPHVAGVNNHMGSLLTRHLTSMVWLMEELKSRPDLFYVDSRTSPVSVAHAVARQSGVPSLSRDVFLDHDASEAAIRRQFAEALAVARRGGQVVMIGHPYPQTLRVLEENLPTLADRGFTLVHVADMIRLQAHGEETWPAYSYPLQTALKK
jgi:hypothetical protein